ncbi:nickel pincer cofactor biosynthesis protein LarC [Brevibacillus fulvus]|uniref:Pyridinium-3,5-bisthiocarboxylic acid mononucleotide nickel insertion protein n=1 Tax=Brevibacillus fulvus TaxID=1125967 RepID=A0A938XZ77_9BACL|nr:nickel pincer cofactor biosynthesis protein LarC [Brevibacillus fulvus]MBM7589604.1 uncharacterized protein (TIGR00299 family) protein [Brevibacillus fulvus]
MNVLYLDCQSGISGDMTLSALLDLGADANYITEQLRALPIDPFRLELQDVNKSGIMAKQLTIRFEDTPDCAAQHHAHDHHHHHHHHHHSHDHEHSHHHHPHRRASSIIAMIEQSDLPSRVKQRSKAIFEVIAQAEGKIHGIAAQDVHFHEVGAMDSIIDIIGSCLALEDLQIDQIICSPVPTGHGKVRMAHGLYPIPAPATAELLTGVPLLAFDVEGELTTPTGAGFVKALASEFGPMPALTMKKIGYGAGKKHFAHPNVLRAILLQDQHRIKRERVVVLECQIDDMTGESYGYLLERLLAEGALDVYYTPVVMKKSRPGVLITVLTTPDRSSQLEQLLFSETTTFGVRRAEWSRIALRRCFQRVATVYGDVLVKVAYDAEKIYQIAPEYEEAKKIALTCQLPLAEVYFQIRLAAVQQLSVRELASRLAESENMV